MRLILVLLLLCLCGALPGRVQSATIRVPADQPTIQAGINAALDGDTVLVAPGTYFENVQIERSVALISEAGAYVTTIDGQDLESVIFVHGTSDHILLEGFRVTHGNAYAGGIGVDFGSPGDSVSIRHNIVEHNQSVGDAAITSWRYSIVQGNLIQYNYSVKGTGALEVYGRVEGNTIRQNGGIGHLYNMLIGTVDEFAWNLVADNEGGRTEVTFTFGGLIHNNTFVRNNQFSATVALSGGPYDFQNNVVIHGQGGGVNCLGNGSRTFRCNDVWGTGGDYIGTCTDQEGINGNFSADPLFCDALHGDYRLTPSSPCAPGNSPSECGLNLIGVLPVGCGVTGVAMNESPSADLRLTVIPNPVRGVARFELGPVAPATALNIFDSQGRLVEQLSRQDGHWEWTPGSSVPAGVYFAKLGGGSTDLASIKFLYLR